MEKQETYLFILGLDKEVKTTTDAYEQFRKLKEINKMLSDKEKELRKDLFDLAEKKGEADEKGSYKVEFEDGTGYQKQARKSMKLKVEDTIKYLKDNNIDGVLEVKKIIPKDEEKLNELMDFLEEKFPEYLEEKEEVNESYLEQSVLEGKIPMKDFESLVEKKVTYALIDLAKKKKK